MDLNYSYYTGEKYTIELVYSDSGFSLDDTGGKGLETLKIWKVFNE